MDMINSCSHSSQELCDNCSVRQIIYHPPSHLDTGVRGDQGLSLFLKLPDLLELLQQHFHFPPFPFYILRMSLDFFMGMAAGLL